MCLWEQLRRSAPYLGKIPRNVAAGLICWVPWGYPLEVAKLLFFKSSVFRYETVNTLPRNNTLQPLYSWTKIRENMCNIVLAQNRGWCDSLGLFLCPLGRNEPWICWFGLAVCWLWGCSQKKIKLEISEACCFSAIKTAVWITLAFESACYHEVKWPSCLGNSYPSSTLDSTSPVRAIVASDPFKFGFHE